MHAKWNALPILGYNCVVEDKLDKEGKKTLGKSQLSANRDAKKGYFARPNTHIGACRLCPIYIIYGGKFLVTFRGAHSKQNWTPLKTASQPTKLDEEGESPPAGEITTCKITLAVSPFPRAVGVREELVYFAVLHSHLQRCGGKEKAHMHGPWQKGMMLVAWASRIFSRNFRYSSEECKLYRMDEPQRMYYGLCT